MGILFSLVAKRARKLETVQRLYSLRRKSKQTPITETERKSYVARLRRDGLIAQAYITWADGLTRTQRQALGLLYNGGFELESAEWGFGWRIPKSLHVLIDRVYTFGSDASKSLHLLVDDHQDLFQRPISSVIPRCRQLPTER